MVIQLALLLLGPSHFKYEWKWLFAFGITLICMGGFMIWDASDRTSYFVIDALGFLLLIAGMIGAARCAMSAWDPTTPFALSRAVTFVIIGLIVVLDPVTMKNLDALLLGSAFMVLGFFKLFFSLLSKYPHWKVIVLGGALNIILGALFFAQWGNDKHWVLPLLFGCMFILMGIGAVSNAWMLRSSRFQAENHGEDIGALDYFLRYHVSRRYRPAFDRLPRPRTVAAKIKSGARKSETEPGELLVHVWMPAECAQNYIPPEGKIPVLSRYLLVRDKEGGLTVGHSSMQMRPDLYISHTDKQWYQKIRNFRHEEALEDFGFFDQIKAHDEEGVFFESYEEEARCWMPATRTIKMLKFNADYLRLFGNFYKMDTTYNLAVRNCSVCIAMALDMALLGCLGGKFMAVRFLKLLFDKDLWLASFIRKRAEDMVWSPGIVRDYAEAMNRLIERHSGPARIV